MERRGCARSAFIIALAAFSLVAAPLGSVAQERTTDSVTEAGDILQIALPAAAFVTTVWLKDWEGSKEFLIGGAVTVASVHVTKELIARTRPDESQATSMPSGHTAAAFFGPAFVHRRYGWKWAAPMYLGAMYVGYTRVHANRHWADDVFFGATLSMVTSWIFTSSYADNVSVVPDLSGDGVGVYAEIRW